MSFKTMINRVGTCLLIGVSAVLLGLAVEGCTKDGDTVILGSTQSGDPFGTNWSQGGHADVNAEPFNHWNSDGEIPTSCAKCHSTPGFLDFTGADGSAAGTVDQPAALGTTIECDACHADASFALREVKFPSGKIVTNLGREAICMQCHQGRESGKSLQAHFVDAGSPAPDSVTTALNFVNIHYLPAGATQYGRDAGAGAEYAGNHYNGAFGHTTSLSTCIDCHDKHTLKVRTEICSNCHDGVVADSDLPKIRMKASRNDFDADGDDSEGLGEEIEGMKILLLQAIEDYARLVSMKEIGYDPDAYPYYFYDTDGNGSIDASEAVFSNGYDSWTPRLLQAAYNYQYAVKDPGAFAHNGKYMIELIYDSLADLDSHASVTVPGLTMVNAMGKLLVRDYPGHFDPDAGPWRHWDGDGSVSSSCARCHSATGMPEWVAGGGGTGLNYLTGFNDLRNTQPLSDGLDCKTCHTDTNYATGDAPVRSIARVSFSSEKDVTFDYGDSSAICAQCHNGRRSAAFYLQDQIDNDPLNAISASDPHYKSGAGIRFGSEAGVFNEYTGQTYEKFDEHDPAGTATDEMSKCAYCHMGPTKDHSFRPENNFASVCVTCHTEATNIFEIRKNDLTKDYDGDTVFDEPIRDEVFGVRDAMVSEMAVYATQHLAANYPAYSTYVNGAMGQGAASAMPDFVYVESSDRWYLDMDGSGTQNTGDLRWPLSSGDRGTLNGLSGGAFTATGWDEWLARANFNLSLNHDEPGHWAHNPRYVMQLYFDTIDVLDEGYPGALANINGSPAGAPLGLTRP